MEVDRKAFGDKTQATIRKQRQAIERWKQENDELRAELAKIEDQHQVEETDTAMAGRLDELNKKIDFYASKLDEERAAEHNYDNQIKLLTRKTKEVQRAMGGTHAAAISSQTVAKQVRVLENRLDKALIKFNEALSHNKTLREQIDNLRHERVVFDGIYRKLERELVEKKKRMAEIIDSSNKAYEQRDLAQEKMNKLKEAHLKAIANLDAEMMNMNRVLKSERRARNFVIIKEQERSGPAPGSAEKPSSSKHKAWQGTRGKLNTDANNEIIQTYEEAFDKIQAATNITNIDELVSTFIEVEDQNFSLFNFVNDLQSEIERLEEHIRELRDRIESAKSEGEFADSERRHALKKLSQRLASAEARTEQYETRYKATLKIINQLRTAVHSLFNRIGCPSTKLLGDEGVTETNIMRYLAMIEARANEIIKMTAVQQLGTEAAEEEPAAHRQRRSTMTALLAQQQSRVPPGGEPLVIQAPSTMDDDSDNEQDDVEAQHPYSREELKARSLQGLTKRQMEAQQGARRGGRRAAGPGARAARRIR